jgi:L-amino acid N-acyltransferase YncA
MRNNVGQNGVTVIRSARADDSDAIARIYNHYVTDTVITFEEQPVSHDEMVMRITEVTSASLPWLVEEESGRVIGYAHASKWKGRCAYRYSVESSVYLDPAFVGRGVGTRLADSLIASLTGVGMHVVIAGIALPNPASVALHEKLGFQQVARFGEVGFKFGRWIDVGYWQRTL